MTIAFRAPRSPLSITRFAASKPGWNRFCVPMLSTAPLRSTASTIASASWRLAQSAFSAQIAFTPFSTA